MKRRSRHPVGTFAGRRPPKSPEGLAKFLKDKEVHTKKHADRKATRTAERVAKRLAAAVSSNEPDSAPPPGHGPKHPLKAGKPSGKKGSSEWNIFVKQNFKDLPSGASFKAKMKELSQMWSQRSEAGSLKDVVNVAAESEVEDAKAGTAASPVQSLGVS